MAFLHIAMCGVIGLQAASYDQLSPGDREQAQIMEQVILLVRRLWFGARECPAGCATLVVEAGGEMLMCIDGDGPAGNELMIEAARRSAYVVTTSFTRPPDLAARLRQAGFRCAQTHGTFLLDEAAHRASLAPSAVTPQTAAPKRGLFGLFHRPGPVEVVVRQIREDELPIWNAVCWRAFGGHTSELYSLREKQQAFRNMGDTARWYLATVDGRPAGTAILFQGPAAAQVLAVGTLPSLRGRGVAGAVMRHLIREWQAIGHGFLFLDTTPGSDAERLYRKLGFTSAYVREVYSPPGCHS
jgi:GNAT superfamily N-acetyltransferase